MLHLFLQNCPAKVSKAVEIANLRRKVSKKRLARFLRLKIDYDLTQHPLDIRLHVQKYQLAFLGTRRPLPLLREVYAFRLRAEKDLGFEDNKAIEGILSSISTSHFQSNEENKLPGIVALTESRTHFYEQFGSLVEEVDSVWSVMSRQKIKEKLFKEKISRILELEEECERVLERLEEGTKTEIVERRLFDSLMQSTNIFYRSPVSRPEATTQTELEQSRPREYLLVRGDRIEGVSHLVASELNCERTDLIGSSFKDILVEGFRNSCGMGLRSGATPTRTKSTG